MTEAMPSGSRNRITFDEPEHRPSTNSLFPSPPAYGDEGGSTLALPINRMSESSRSDGSSNEHGVYATTTTTTHTVQTTTTFFRLPRRKKSPLFPLPPKIVHTDSATSLTVPGSYPANDSGRPSFASEGGAVRGVRGPLNLGGDSRLTSPLPSPSHTNLAKSSLAFAAPIMPLVRHGSNASASSSPSKLRLGLRGRSSTLSSLRNLPSDDTLPTPQLDASVRTSTSTGRKSFGDIFGLSNRLRHNSEPMAARLASGPATPASNTSKNNSMQLSREPTVVIPERHEDDTPAKYLVRLEEAVSRSVVASILSKGSDTFSQQVLRSYLRSFMFFGDPMDMAIRRLLMTVELPKETQHIDRFLQSFANRYHECNPGIFTNPDQAYFIAFSLLILHTDVFNKNNKHKMQKSEYIRNTQGEGIFDEILESFYDNISYTPFIHVEDDFDINGERIVQHKTKKKSMFPRAGSDPQKRLSKEPVDPYTLIFDNKLDVLRPNLKDIMHLDEHYSYLGTAQSLNLQDLQKTFFKTGILQIVSARSRPDAFINMSDRTLSNPEEAHPGIVDIKITKVGILWRKDTKKKKTRSPWQEWGAILTGAQLYFFRNVGWIKNLMHQLEVHVKQGHDGIPVIFKPPLEQFKPDALMSTNDAVALLDSTYKKHKHAFLLVRHGGFEETFLAEDEVEMNDWLAKLNYAAAFRTSGVRMRGVVGGHYEGQRTRGIRRLDSDGGMARSVQTPTGEVTIVSGGIDTKMAEDILAARREIMLQKISEAEGKLALAQKQLDDILRNARHLQILAPIQPKTREQILLAAARMEAKLKWIRIEIWRLKCHRDILRLDLEDEKGSRRGRGLEVEENFQPPSSVGVGLSSLDSKASAATSKLRLPWATEARPSTQPSPANERNYGMDDIFSTSPPAGGSSSFHKAQASWELPPLPFEHRARRNSSLPSYPTKSSALLQTNSFPTASSKSTPEKPQPAIPQADAAEHAVLEEAGFGDVVSIVSTTDRRSQNTAPDADGEDGKEGPEGQEREKGERGNVIRRSLHRTLREAHVPTHLRNRKGKESAVTAEAVEGAGSEDVLSRGTGSFIIHGKKASVITFGEDFQALSNEERLRLRKQGRTDGSSEPTHSSGDRDSTSTITEYDIRHAHRGSAASTSTATARSFRELHQRLSAHALASQAANMRFDGADAETAASFSEGAVTPVPTSDGATGEQRAVSYGSSGQKASSVEGGEKPAEAVPMGTDLSPGVQRHKRSSI
jgi:hypothetical protein